MMRETKYVPELRFSEFKESWNIGMLGNLINSLDAGVSVNSGDKPAINNEKGILKTSCVTSGSFDPKENKVVDVQGELLRLKEPVAARTIIISRMNTPALVGANSFIRKSFANLFLPDRLWAGTVNLNHCPEWVGILFSTSQIRTAFSTRATGTSGSMKNITKNDVLTVPSYFPDKEEQQKIAAFLGSVDDKLSKLYRKRELLETHKRGLMQKIFSQEPRFKQDNSTAFPDWAERPLGEIFTRITCKNNENNKNVLTISAQQGLINQEIFFNKSVSAQDVTGYYLLEKGAFAYNKSYSKGYPMGAIKRLNNYDKGVVSTLYICFKSNIKAESGFYEHYFDSGFLNKELHKIAQEGARNHGLLNLSVVEFFKDITIPRPNVGEQQKIANFLTAIDKKIEAVANQITQVETFKKGLLQKMFPSTPLRNRLL